MTRCRGPLLLTAALGAALLVATAGAQDEEPPRAEFVDAFPGHTFERPVFVAQAPGTSPSFYVGEQAGRIVEVNPEDEEYKAVFLDIAERVQPSSVYTRGNEEGFFAFAFHPAYETNGRLFVNYTRRYESASDRCTVVSEFTAAAGAVDPSTERVILETPQPGSTNNGGMLSFGPDGMLYVAVGVGAETGTAQTLSDPYGSILRIDVDAKRKRYAVPKDNPFPRNPIWAHGFRNPWRFSFDRDTGELWAGDVSQESREEINYVERGGNYGYGARSGKDLRPAAFSYPRTQGFVVIGGYVYRGHEIPWLRGSYLFTDFMTGKLWGLTRSGEGPPRTPDDVDVKLLIEMTGETIASFGEDRRGELYACSFQGRVLRLEDSEGGPFSLQPSELSETGLFADLAKLEPVAGAHRYAVNVPFWSDGAEKDRFFVLPEGGSLTWRDDGAFEAPEGTRFVKTFTLAGQRLETRVIERTDDGWDATTYVWNDDVADAERLNDPLRRSVVGPGGPQAWEFPSPGQCQACHTPTTGYLLGVNARQVTLPDGGDALAAWTSAGVLKGAPEEVAASPRHAPTESDESLERRARSYLAANCAGCHQPTAPHPAGLDLRASTALERTGLLRDEPAHGSLGLRDARVVWPGKPARSTLLRRMQHRGAGQMPPLGSSVPDAAGIELLTRWIKRVRKR